MPLDCRGTVRLSGIRTKIYGTRFRGISAGGRRSRRSHLVVFWRLRSRHCDGIISRVHTFGSRPHIRGLGVVFNFHRRNFRARSPCNRVWFDALVDDGVVARVYSVHVDGIFVHDMNAIGWQAMPGDIPVTKPVGWHVRVAMRAQPPAEPKSDPAAVPRKPDTRPVTATRGQRRPAAIPVVIAPRDPRGRPD